MLLYREKGKQSLQRGGGEGWLGLRQNAKVAEVTCERHGLKMSGVV